jgi:hypothetical protein
MFYQPEEKVKSLLVATLKMLAPNKLELIELVEKVGAKSFWIEAEINKPINLRVETNDGSANHYFTEDCPSDAVMTEVSKMWGIPIEQMDRFALVADEGKMVKWTGGGFCTDGG